MNTYEFSLIFALPSSEEDPDAYVEALYEAGCDDATIGIGRKGQIALEFDREATSAEAAIASAFRDVRKAIPRAQLIEASPDYVGLTEVADIVGFSRQNMRKLMLFDVSSFPVAVHGGSPAVYHLQSVLEWFKKVRNLHVHDDLIEISAATRQVNLAKELSQLPKRALKKRLSDLVLG